MRREALLVLALVLAGCSSSPDADPPSNPPGGAAATEGGPEHLLRHCHTVTWRGETPEPLAQQALPHGYEAQGPGTTTVYVEAFDCEGELINGSWQGRGKFAMVSVMVDVAEGREHPDEFDYLVLERFLDQESPEVAIAMRSGPWAALLADIFVSAHGFGVREAGDHWINSVMNAAITPPFAGVAGQKRVHVADGEAWVDVFPLGYQSLAGGDLAFGSDSSVRRFFPSSSVTNMLPGDGRVAFLDTYELRPFGEAAPRQ